MASVEDMVNNVVDQLRADNNRLSNHLQTCVQMNEMLLKYRFSLISYLNECQITNQCHQSHPCHHSFDLIHHVQQLEELFQPLRHQIQGVFLTGLDKTIECLDIQLKNPEELYRADNGDNRVTVNDVTAIQDMDTGSEQFMSEDQYSDRLDSKASVGLLTKPERSIQCEVRGCHKSFSSRNSLCIHIHRYHKNANTFECFNCKKCFAFRSLLRKHQMSCNSQMTEESHLQTSDDQSSLDISSLIQRNACQLIATNAASGSSYMIPTKLLTHNHLFPNDIPSDGTDESNDNLEQRHELIVCEAKGCLKTLSSKNSLNIHLSRFHKNTQTFECFQCKLCFTNRSLLKNHQSVSKCKQTVCKHHSITLGLNRHRSSHYSHNNHMADVLPRDRHKSGPNCIHRKIVCEVKGL